MAFVEDGEEERETDCMYIYTEVGTTHGLSSCFRPVLSNFGRLWALFGPATLIGIVCFLDIVKNIFIMKITLIEYQLS